MTPIEKAAKLRRELITAMDKASNELNSYCAPHKGAMGLVSDEIRQGETYRNLSYNYQKAKDNLALFNTTYKGKEYAKAFKAETMQHYKRV
jgi:hypothetical protein